MKYAKLTPSVFLVCVLIGCGSEQDWDSAPDPGEQDRLNAPADSILTVSDTLSADLFLDFGIVTVDDIDASSDGLIAILDGVEAAVTLVSSSSELIGRTGGSGSGPGEFQWPVAIAVSEDGHLAVSDFMAGTVRVLEPDLGTYTDIQGFNMANPGELNLNNDGSFSGMRITFKSDNGSTVIGPQAALWSLNSSDPEIIYREKYETFTPNDFGRSIVSPYPITCGPERSVYVAEVSCDEYILYSYHSDGTLLWSVEPPFEPTEKTELELQTEEDMVTRFMQQSTHQMNFTPEPFHYSVSSLAIGPEGRLWAGRPGSDSHFFDVFDPETGNLLFTVSVEDDLMFERIEVTRGGILGISGGEYPSLMVLSIGAP